MRSASAAGHEVGGASALLLSLRYMSFQCYKTCYASCRDRPNSRCVGGHLDERHTSRRDMIADEHPSRGRSATAFLLALAFCGCAPTILRPADQELLKAAMVVAAHPDVNSRATDGSTPLLLAA